MSKKAAKKAQIQESAAQGRGIGSSLLAFGASVLVMGLVSVALTFVMSGTADMGNVLTLAAAAVLALCWHKEQVSNQTLVFISLLLGFFIGLFMGAVHIGYFFAVNEGSLLLFEDGGLAAVELSSGIGVLDVVRRFLMHLFFNSTYGMIFNISLAGIIDICVSLAFYVFFMRFMVKRARS